MIAALAQEFPVETLCRLLDCPRSSFYYRELSENDEVRDLIEKIATEFPRYGYRRITVELARRGTTVDRKRVLKIMKEECLLVSVKNFVKPAYLRHDLPKYPTLIRNVTLQHADQIGVATSPKFAFIRNGSIRRSFSTCSLVPYAAGIWVET